MLKQKREVVCLNKILIASAMLVMLSGVAVADWVFDIDIGGMVNQTVVALTGTLTQNINSGTVNEVKYFKADASGYSSVADQTTVFYDSVNSNGFVKVSVANLNLTGCKLYGSFSGSNDVEFNADRLTYNFPVAATGQKLRFYIKLTGNGVCNGTIKDLNVIQ